MKSLWILLLAAILALPLSHAAEIPEPMREFRAAWVATVFNIDWPSKPGLPASTQQAELRAILDRAAGLGLNAILLQVRPSCDAFYASKREPWSAFLTGKMGQPPEPAYDPLEFAVKEAHARGIEMHAWFNPFRAVASANATPAANHVARTHPEWIRRYGSQSWIDPGEPEARKWSLDTVLDVVRRYDIDGVHIDDYFYPYPVKGGGGVLPFPDDPAWKRYTEGGGKLSRDDWRRENINIFVRDLYTAIKAEKRWVKFGISPFGVWRPRVPEQVEAQLDAYAQLYGDSKKWWNQGWCDYYSPQLYWPIQGPQSYTALLKWWSEQNTQKRHLWPGIATGRVGPQRPAAEMVNQIAIEREVQLKSPGHVHWNFKALKQNLLGVTDLLKTASYAERAVPPSSPWLGETLPPAPGAKRVGNKIEIAKGNPDSVRWWVVQSRKAGRWSTERMVFATAQEAEWPANAEAVAVRGMSAAGVLGDAVVLE